MQSEMSSSQLRVAAAIRKHVNLIHKIAEETLPSSAAMQPEVSSLQHRPTAASSKQIDFVHRIADHMLKECNEGEFEIRYLNKSEHEVWKCIEFDIEVYLRDPEYAHKIVNLLIIIMNVRLECQIWNVSEIGKQLLRVFMWERFAKLMKGVLDAAEASKEANQKRIAQDLPALIKLPVPALPPTNIYADGNEHWEDPSKPFPKAVVEFVLSEVQGAKEKDLPIDFDTYLKPSLETWVQAAQPYYHKTITVDSILSGREINGAEGFGHLPLRTRS